MVWLDHTLSVNQWMDISCVGIAVDACPLFIFYFCVDMLFLLRTCAEGGVAGPS